MWQVFNGLMCAGKIIHEVLLDADNVRKENVIDKYVQECQMILCHPNITPFLGMCILPNYQLPALVMERLEGSPDDLLETVSDLPLVLKRSILEDVARGLLYLHNHYPQIIHRDLTAKNTLLTMSSSFVAKNTDLGIACIVDLQPSQLAPPEALTAVSCYDHNFDVFLFGRLIAQVINPYPHTNCI